MGSTFETTKDLRSGEDGLSGHGDRGRKRKLSMVCDGDAGVEGDRREANLVSDVSSETLDKADSDPDGQIATEYRKTPESYDHNDELTQELKRSRATIDELNQLMKESAARDKKTSEELKTKTAEITDPSNQMRQETLELEKSRAKIQELNQLLEESVARERETSEELKGKVVANGQLTTRLQESITMMEKWQLVGENQEMGAAADSSNEDQSPTFTTDDEDETVPLHQYFNKALSDHFYTTDWKELEGGKDGYVYEGVVGRVFPSPVKGTTGLCRHINARTGKHLYTTEWSKDSDEWKKMGFASEKIICYISISPIEGKKTTALYSSYNSQKTDHLLTTVWEDTRSSGCKRNVAGYVYEII